MNSHITQHDYVELLRNITTSRFEINKRAWIFIGTKCEYHCPFCYYKNRSYFYDEDVILKQIKIAKESCFTSIDLSGGEPTIFSGIERVINYAKDMLNLQVGIVTNTSKYHSYFDDLDDILLSFHGHTYGTETWRDKLKLCDILLKRKGFLRLNITLYSETQFHILDTLQSMLRDKAPLQINILPYNLWSESKLFVDRLNLAKKFIDELLPFITSSIHELRLRYVPFCIFETKDIVTGFAQHIFDVRDWHLASYKIHTHQHVNLILDALRAYVSKETFVPDICKQCSLYPICDKFQSQNEYKQVSCMIKPYMLDYKVYDPLFFIKEETAFAFRYKTPNL